MKCPFWKVEYSTPFKGGNSAVSWLMEHSDHE